MKINIKKEQLSDDEYFRILGFVYDLWNGDEGRKNVLNCLNNWFGCVCSSFWLVEDDASMTNPVGANISERLLQDYENEFYLSDTVYIKHRNSDFASDSIVVENINIFNEHSEKETPYMIRLRKEGIWHRYSIFLRERGKIKGTIAIFDSIEGPQNNQISLKCLETVVPFINKEFAKQEKTKTLKQELYGLRTVVKYNEIGLIVFEQDNINNIVYHNAMGVKYCQEFVGERGSKRVIAVFLEKMVKPLDNIGCNFNDMAISMTSPKGHTYKIKIVGEVSSHKREKKTDTLFITPIPKLPDTEGDILAERTCQKLIPQLTSKEKEIVMYIFQGLTNKQIAEKMFISVSTVKTHIQHIFSKAEVKNRTSLMAILNSNIDKEEE